jgi:hypothetical protein
VKSLKFRNWGSLVANGGLKIGFASGSIEVILAVDRDLSAKKGVHHGPQQERGYQNDRQLSFKDI